MPESLSDENHSINHQLEQSKKKERGELISEVQGLNFLYSGSEDDRRLLIIASAISTVQDIQATLKNALESNFHDMQDYEIKELLIDVLRIRKLTPAMINKAMRHDDSIPWNASEVWKDLDELMTSLHIKKCRTDRYSNATRH